MITHTPRRPPAPAKSVKPPREWQSVKANIIRNYATVRAYAARLGCHYNSIRNAVAYQGGAIHAQMQKDGLL